MTIDLRYDMNHLIKNWPELHHSRLDPEAVKIWHDACSASTTEISMSLYSLDKVISRLQKFNSHLIT